MGRGSLPAPRLAVDDDAHRDRPPRPALDRARRHLHSLSCTGPAHTRCRSRGHSDHPTHATSIVRARYSSSDVAAHRGSGHSPTGGVRGVGGTAPGCGGILVLGSRNPRIPASPRRGPGTGRSRPADRATLRPSRRRPMRKAMRKAMRSRYVHRYNAQFPDRDAACADPRSRTLHQGSSWPCREWSATPDIMFGWAVLITSMILTRRHRTAVYLVSWRWFAMTPGGYC